MKKLQGNLKSQYDKKKDEIMNAKLNSYKKYELNERKKLDLFKDQHIIADDM